MLHGHHRYPGNDSHPTDRAVGRRCDRRAHRGSQVDTAVTLFFLAAVAIIFIGCFVEWVRLLSGAKKAQLREDPYVALPDAA